MKYIPPSSKIAFQWIDVCANSLEISMDDASDIYAHLCGANNWGDLLSAIESGTPSNDDSTVHPKILELRRNFYVKVLINRFGINPSIAHYISIKFSPSSLIFPTVVSIDLNRIYAADEEKSSFELCNLSTALDRLVSARPQLVKNSTYTIENGYKPSGPVKSLLSIKVCPALCYNVLTSLQWKVDKESYNNVYCAGKPSFLVFSRSSKEVIPIYISELTRYPYDIGDTRCNDLMDEIQKDVEVNGYSRAILFWYALTTKKIKGLNYTHPGMVYIQGQWKETLINAEMNDVEDMFKCSEVTPDINQPDPVYCDRGGALMLGFQLMYRKVSTLSELKIMAVSSPTGWYALITTNKEV